MLHQHGADLGRDPAEIQLSSHVWLDRSGDPGSVVDAIEALAQDGLDLAIVYLPPPHTPAVLAPLANALSAIG